jgi:hypothetical protein
MEKRQNKRHSIIEKERGLVIFAGFHTSQYVTNHFINTTKP